MASIDIKYIEARLDRSVSDLVLRDRLLDLIKDWVILRDEVKGFRKAASSEGFSDWITTGDIHKAMISHNALKAELEELRSYKQAMEEKGSSDSNDLMHALDQVERLKGDLAEARRSEGYWKHKAEANNDSSVLWRDKHNKQKAKADKLENELETIRKHTSIMERCVITTRDGEAIMHIHENNMSQIIMREYRIMPLEDDADRQVALEMAKREIHADCTEEGCSDLCRQLTSAIGPVLTADQVIQFFRDGPGAVDPTKEDS